MFIKFKEWLIHLLTPHCSDCESIEADRRICQSCETLRAQLDYEREEKNKLLQYVMNINRPQEEIHIEEDDKELKAINNNRPIPWHIKARELEKKDRELYKQIKLDEDKRPKEDKEAVELLEKELS